MTRRRGVVAAVAVAAAGAGLGWAWWRPQRSEGAESEADAAAQAGVWNQVFETPGGGEVALSSFKGRPLILNFWATWCAPCVQEMPLLDRFHRQHQVKGWQVLGLAIDSRGPVQEFLVQHPVAFPIGLAGAQGVDLSRALGNAHGGLPFSVVFNREGAPIGRKLGAFKEENLADWVARVG